MDTRWLRLWTSTWSEVDNSQRTRTLGALDPSFLERDERMDFLEEGPSMALSSSQGLAHSSKTGPGSAVLKTMGRPRACVQGMPGSLGGGVRAGRGDWRAESGQPLSSG